jgi:hypothetical protein
MDENGIVIWKSRAHTLSFIVLLGLFIGVVLFGIFFQKNELRDVLLGVFVLAVLIGLFVFLIKHWRRQLR